MMYNYGFYGDHMFFGGLFTILFWVGLVALIVWAVHGKKGCGGGCCKMKNDALDILKERYARGEIGKEEFDAKKKDLEG